MRPGPRTAIAAAVALLATGMLVVGMARRAQWPGIGDSTELPAGSAGTATPIESYPTVNALTQLPDWIPERYDLARDGFGEPSSIAELVQTYVLTNTALGGLVAGVVVAHVSDPVFNTADGLPPAAPTPEMGNAQYGLITNMIVVLDIVEPLAGVPQGVDGLVVAWPGGDIGDYHYVYSPSPVFREGDAGILLAATGAYQPGAWNYDVGYGVTGRMIKTAELWSAGGRWYMPADIGLFWKHQGEMMLSDISGEPDSEGEGWQPEIRPWDEFEAELAQALAPLPAEKVRPNPADTAEKPTSFVADPSEISVPTAAVGYRTPISSPEDAIARSVADLPIGLAVGSSATRLVTAQTAFAWLEFGPDAYDPGDPLWQEWDPDTPFWIVGLLIEGVSVGDVLRFPADGNVRPAEGAFYVWDATSGLVVSQGALETATPANWASLSALPSQELSITAATDLPPQEWGTRVPTSTSEPDDVATGIWLATNEPEALMTVAP